MPSLAHQFILDLLEIKMRQDGYTIVHHEGKSVYKINDLPIPPKILHHRPDLIGVKDGSIAIGEAKTENDFGERTKTQILDFTNQEIWHNQNTALLTYFGIPLTIVDKFETYLKQHSIVKNKYIILSVPDRLLPPDDL